MPTFRQNPSGLAPNSVENGTFPDGHVKPSPRALTVVAWSFCRHPQFVATQLHTGLWTVRCPPRKRVSSMSSIVFLTPTHVLSPVV